MTDTILHRISSERCTGCGVCAEVCPGEAVVVQNSKPVFTDMEDCSYCGVCEELCPVGAIELEFEIL
jgi:NAD-dependent dihydropyrimidine dehydrogenase PreA subunit